MAISAADRQKHEVGGRASDQSPHGLSGHETRDGKRVTDGGYRVTIQRGHMIAYVGMGKSSPA